MPDQPDPVPDLLQALLESVLAARAARTGIPPDPAETDVYCACQTVPCHHERAEDTP